MPFNVRAPVPAEAPPQTLAAAYKRYVGHGLEQPDWEAYEKAVDLILRDKVPVNGHDKNCPVAGFPSGLSDVFNAVEDGNMVVKCRHCGYVLSRMQPDATEVVAR